MGVIGGGLFLLLGIANLINPEVPEAYLTQNTITCLAACFIGLVFFTTSNSNFTRSTSQKQNATLDNRLEFL